MLEIKIENVQTRLKEFIVEQILVEPLEQELQPDTDLIAGGILDSMAIIRLINFIKETFSIQIAPEQVMFENFQSIENMSRLVVESSAQ